MYWEGTSMNKKNMVIIRSIKAKNCFCHFEFIRWLLFLIFRQIFLSLSEYRISTMCSYMYVFLGKQQKRKILDQCFNIVHMICVNGKLTNDSKIAEAVLYFIFRLITNTAPLHTLIKIIVVVFINYLFVNWVVVIGGV